MSYNPQLSQFCHIRVFLRYPSGRDRPNIDQKGLLTGTQSHKEAPRAGGGIRTPLWPHLAKRSMMSSPPLPVHVRSPYLDPLGHEFPYTFDVHVHLHCCYID